MSQTVTPQAASYPPASLPMRPTHSSLQQKRRLRATALDDRPSASFAKPSTLLMAAEPARAAAELAWFAAALPFLRNVPRGDGRPVLVIPGFTASDASTEVLRRYLTDVGYNAFGWKQGVNLGPNPTAVNGMLERFDQIIRLTAQPLTLIGWSLGGLYARALAERDPDNVRHVITLGSPFRLAMKEQTNAGALYEILNQRKRDSAGSALRAVGYRGAPRVPSTAIFTRTDGVVPWQSCIDEPGHESENVEVRGSHTGLGHNPAAVTVITDRLRLAEGEFVPFNPASAGTICNRLYPATPHRD